MPETLLWRAGAPAAGAPGCPVAREFTAPGMPLAGQTVTGLYGKPQLGDQEGDPGLVGTAGGREGEGKRQERVKANLCSRHRAGAASLKGAGGRAARALGRGSGSPGGWEAGREADTGPGSQHGPFPDPEEGQRRDRAPCRPSHCRAHGSRARQAEVVRQTPTGVMPPFSLDPRPNLRSSEQPPAVTRFHWGRGIL